MVAIANTNLHEDHHDCPTKELLTQFGKSLIPGPINALYSDDFGVFWIQHPKFQSHLINLMNLMNLIKS